MLNRLPPLTPSLFERNRKRLVSELKPGSLLVLNSSDISPTSGDGIRPYRQDSNFFYLTGINQEDSILILFPEASHPRDQEILFITESNPSLSMWEGDKLSPEEAAKRSGIQRVQYLSEFSDFFKRLMHQAEHVYLNQDEHYRRNSPVQSREDRFIKWSQQQYPLHHYERLCPLLSRLRMVKSEEEIERIQQACHVTRDGFLRLLKNLKPGVKEYELEAELIYEFTRRGTDGFAYGPILASGANACILHYQSNADVCQDGEVLLIDAGASYGSYQADLSRSVPIGGSFSSRQREVYESVLRVMEYAKTQLKIGVLLSDYEKKIGKCMEEELLKLNLLSQKDIQNSSPQHPAYKRYFMHGTSHHLGLDVHDLANMSVPLSENMVLTVEPGIYIPEEGLGIRLEDDVVLRKGGIENLTKSVPLQVEEIEELIGGSS
ncbi:MAG: aminopeptidase P N-terminal domain-containing protein [Cytophagales bacterium]|nr:aminopeptidase P N-terminal domain-containing protein [Cytophagales bacterium]